VTDHMILRVNQPPIICLYLVIHSRQRYSV